MLVGVCDFPGEYPFPPSGYGGIERWLWAVAIGARSTGADVHLLGPGWRRELEPAWTIQPTRLETILPGSREFAHLRSTAYDLLVVGHEYPSLPAWRQVREELDCDVATFQHAPNFQHSYRAFDGKRDRLYCYSTEMVERYADHHPIHELAVHHGIDEAEPPAIAGRDLVWVGRIDAEKAPHLAVRAAQILGRRIRLVGPVFDPEYVREYGGLLSSDHVEWAGELGGQMKTAAFHGAATFVYTYARNYVEAGAAVFGEALRAGTPVAALSWRKGTCAEAALCGRTGATALISPEDDDETAAQALAEAIERTDHLDYAEVQALGQARFDPGRHFEAIAARPC
jgi:glycosyltransferase involved in cell wall biosynthesis